MQRYAEEVRRSHGVHVADPRRAQLRRGGGARDRQRPAHGLHGRRPDDAPGRAHGAAREPGHASCHRRRRSQLAEGYVAGEAARAGAGEGARRAVEVYELTGAGPARTRLAGGRRARAHALRRPRRRAGAAPPRPSSCAARARPGRGARRRGRGGQVAPGLGVHPLAPRAGLAGPGERLGLVRQGDELPAGDRPAQGLLRDRGPGRPARDPREGDGQAARARPGPRSRRCRRCWRCSTCRWTTRSGRHSIRRSAASARSTPSSGCCCGRARCSRCCVIFEDLHWIDAETQALLDSLVESLPTGAAAAARELPAGVPARLGRARPTTAAPARPAAGRERRGAARGAPRRRSRAGAAQAAPDRATEGNPFFLEESVRTLVETKALAGERGRYRLTQPLAGDPGAGHRPGVLAARIDRLAPEDKHLLQVGRRHRQGRAVRAAPGDRRAAGRGAAPRARPPAGRRVPLRDALFPDLEYTFKHALTHEVAYGSLLRSGAGRSTPGSSRRSRRSIRDRLAEHVERLAHHAVRGEVWEKAVRYLRQAGAKAAARSALPEAVACSSRRWRRSSVCRRAADTLEQAFDTPPRAAAALLPAR